MPAANGIIDELALERREDLLLVARPMDFTHGLGAGDFTCVRNACFYCGHGVLLLEQSAA